MPAPSASPRLTAFGTCPPTFSPRALASATAAWKASGVRRLYTLI